MERQRVLSIILSTAITELFYCIFTIGSLFVKHINSAQVPQSLSSNTTVNFSSTIASGQ